jgi:hypothetical protein
LDARAEGVELIGPGVLLTGLTRKVLETALEAQITEHLGHDKRDPAGRNRENSRNGTRPKAVLTEVGPVEIAVQRDRGTVHSRQRNLRSRAGGGDHPAQPHAGRRRQPRRDQGRLRDRGGRVALTRASPSSTGNSTSRSTSSPRPSPDTSSRSCATPPSTLNPDELCSARQCAAIRSVQGVPNVLNSANIVARTRSSCARVGYRPVHEGFTGGRRAADGPPEQSHQALELGKYGSYSATFGPPLKRQVRGPSRSRGGPLRFP